MVKLLISYLSLHTAFHDLCLLLPSPKGIISSNNWPYLYVLPHASCIIFLSFHCPPVSGLLLVTLPSYSVISQIGALCFPSFPYLPSYTPDLILSAVVVDPLALLLSSMIEPVSFCSSLQTCLERSGFVALGWMWNVCTSFVGTCWSPHESRGEIENVWLLAEDDACTLWSVLGGQKKNIAVLGTWCTSSISHTKTSGGSRNICTGSVGWCMVSLSVGIS